MIPGPLPSPLEALRLRSILIAAAVLLGVLWLHLLSAVFAGLAGYVLYRKVSEHPTVRDLWARTLETRGVVESGRAQSLANLRLDGMQRMYDALDPEKSLVEALPEIAAPGTAAAPTCRAPRR